MSVEEEVEEETKSIRAVRHLYAMLVASPSHCRKEVVLAYKVAVEARACHSLLDRSKTFQRAGRVQGMMCVARIRSD